MLDLSPESEETKRRISETQRGLPPTPPPEPGLGAPFDP